MLGSLLIGLAPSGELATAFLLTGRALQGLSAAVEQILDLPVRLGLPQNLTGDPGILANPGYATALGVITYRHLGDWSRSRRAVRRVGLGTDLDHKEVLLVRTTTTWPTDDV